METKERSRTRIGFSRMEKKYEWKDHVIFMGILLATAVWVNRNIEIKGLYMDDLYFWSCYGEQGFLQYVFPLGSTRFRFLYYLAAWLEMAVVGNHVNWFVPFNILLNTAVSCSVYLIGRRLSRSKGIGFLCGFMYLISRMAYYQIGQVLGLMETMALWMAIGILWYLYRYLDGEDGRKYYYMSCALYFGVCFVHERYMVLLPLLLFVLLVKGSKDLTEWGAGLSSFLLVQAIRVFAIGSVLPAGTGGTQVADTFSLADTIRHGLSQIAYVFGINAGPEHLNGRPWAQSPLAIRILVLLADAAIAVIVLGFLIKVIRDKRKDVKGKVLCSLALFLLFIGACIASSSVTIRVEMRWVYVSLTAALLLLAYMYGYLTEGVKPELYLKRLWPWGAAFACYVILMLPAELFYRAQYPNLYLWPDQLRYNSLAEETYGRYGDSLFGKNIYIIGSSYEMSDFTARTFFKVFDKERTAEGTSVEFIDSIRDIGLVDSRMLVLREDPEHNGFQDITQFVKEIKLNVEYGYYDDGWMDEHASLTVMAGETGVIDLEIIYPGVMSGGEGIKITKDQDEPFTIPVRSTVVNQTIEAEPWQMVHLTFDYNFYMHNAQEQRGKDRLAAIVHMTAR